MTTYSLEPHTAMLASLRRLHKEVLLMSQRPHAVNFALQRNNPFFYSWRSPWPDKDSRAGFTSNLKKWHRGVDNKALMRAVKVKAPSMCT